MCDLLCLFHTAEQKFVVLRTVKFFLLSAHFMHQYAFYNQKMADIIVCTQQIQIKIRFKIRLVTLA